jgi:hypothetical protein
MGLECGFGGVGYGMFDTLIGTNTYVPYNLPLFNRVCGKCGVCTLF